MNRLSWRKRHKMLNMQGQWYGSSSPVLNLFLTPLSWLFAGVSAVRRGLYQTGIKKIARFDVPVLVVGNITVGGTGKTPFVIWLAEFLRTQGFKPGIVSRGYGGKASKLPQVVNMTSQANDVGDEAVLIARKSACPMVVCVDRVAAVRELLKTSDCNMVISDDGMQHYALGRDLEFAIVDGVRRFGNAKLLPAGPLREPVSRLKNVDYVVVQEYALAGEYQMTLAGNQFISILNPQQNKSVDGFRNGVVHAVAAIGNPDRFFNLLRGWGIEVIPHVFPDHHLYAASDLQFGDELPIIMTEKDAVKCKNFAREQFWYLPVKAVIEQSLVEELCVKIKSLKSVG